MEHDIAGVGDNAVVSQSSNGSGRQLRPAFGGGATRCRRRAFRDRCQAMDAARIQVVASGLGPPAIAQGDVRSRAEHQRGALLEHPAQLLERACRAVLSARYAHNDRPLIRQAAPDLIHAHTEFVGHAVLPIAREFGIPSSSRCTGSTPNVDCSTRRGSAGACATRCAP